MSSWRDQTTVSGEWRSCDFEDEAVVGFLQDLVEIMGTIVDDEVEGEDINNVRENP